jgi:hypothetical protein
MFKILLILHNAPEHSKHIDNLHPDTEVVYLPQTALVEPVDQDHGYVQSKLYQIFSQADAAIKSG